MTRSRKANRPKSSGPEVVIPEREGIQLVHVAAIAAVGFGIGILWPRLAGVSLVPAVPVDGAQSARPASSALASGPESAEEPSKPAPQEPSPENAPPEAQQIEVGEAQVTSCRDAGGKELGACDSLDVDALAKERLRALAACPGASSVSGKLSIGLELNLAKQRVVSVKSGRTTNLPAATTKQLLDCATRDFEKVSLAKVKGEHEVYTVYYPVEFRLPEAKVAPSDVVVASGQATVRWNAALIRKEPETAAEVRARLLSGTRVVVTGRKGEWYRVKYDAKGREGWVHGAAIGL